jgi:hypothetical protein
MAVLLCYFAGAGQQNDPRKWFTDAGLGSMLSTIDDDPTCAANPDEQPAYSDGTCFLGPDGGQGRIAYWNDQRTSGAPKPPCVEREKQVWYPLPKRGELPAGRAWFGWWKDDPIVPADLLRKRPLPGTDVELGRYSWNVPTARNLPRVFSFDAEGARTWSYEKEAHVRYFDEAWRLVAKMGQTFREGSFSYELDELLTFVEQALAINYRVSLELLDAMKAIREESIWKAAYVAAGFPVDDSDGKKNSLTTEPGGTG